MIFDWLRRVLYGSGTIYFEYVDTAGRSGRGSLPYNGDISTLDHSELKAEVSEQMRAKFGYPLKEFCITKIESK